MFSKTYFKDKAVLFLMLISLLTCLTSIGLILLSVDFSEVKIVYRYLPEAVGEQFEIVNLNYIYTFMTVTVLSLISGWLMSYKIYELHIKGAYLTLGLTNIVLIANLLIIESLLRI